jgi:hypothetical protein
MKFGARVRKYDFEPREYFAERVALLIEETILRDSTADYLRVSVVETNELGEPLAD